jgi:hypothetical protein
MFIPGMPQTKVCLAAIGHLSSSFVQPGMLSVVWQSRRPAIQWIVLWWLFARSVVSHNSALFCVGEWILVFRWKKRHFEPCDIWQSLLCPYQFEVSDLWRLCQDSLLSFALPLPFLLIHIYYIYIFWRLWADSFWGTKGIIYSLMICVSWVSAELCVYGVSLQSCKNIVICSKTGWRDFLQQKRAK